MAQAATNETIQKANTYRATRTDAAAAEAYHFTKRLEAFARAPLVYKNNTYLDFMRQSLQEVQKYVIDSAVSEWIIEINDEEQIPADWFDLTPTSDEGTQP